MQLDTSTPTGKLMLTMLGAIAEFERELMLERQRETLRRLKPKVSTRAAPTARRKADEVLQLKKQRKTVPEIVATLGNRRACVFRHFDKTHDVSDPTFFVQNGMSSSMPSGSKAGAGT